MYAIAITADIYKALTVRKVHVRDSYLSEISKVILHAKIFARSNDSSVKLSHFNHQSAIESAFQYPSINIFARIFES